MQPDKLEDHVRKLSEEFTPRNWSNPVGQRRTVQYIATQFAKNSNNVELQDFKVGSQKFHNVVARYGSNGGPLVIVGAHFDAYNNLPGADDNASGVAGLIELGRILQENPVAVDVALVAYNLEEPPFFGTEHMGSAHHADSVIREGEKVLLMISLEMIGYFTSEPDSQNYPHPLLKLLYPSQGNFITIVGGFDFSPHTLNIKKSFLERTDLPVVSINAPRSLPGIDFSDHRNYWEKGFPAVMITDTAFYRNKYYHTLGDTADRLNYQQMAKVVAGVYAFLSSLE